MSVDASGELHVYATTLDMTKKEATARIDALDPYYGLAIVGQFSHAPLMVASAASGYAIVNAGAQSARVPLANVASDGEGAVASSTLSAGNSTRGATDGWVKAWADSASVAAASWQENGKLLAVAPGTKPEQNFLVPGLEYTSRKTAEPSGEPGQYRGGGYGDAREVRRKRSGTLQRHDGTQRLAAGSNPIAVSGLAAGLCGLCADPVEGPDCSERPGQDRPGVELHCGRRH